MARLPFRPNWGRFKNKLAAALYWMRKRQRARFENIRIDAGDLWSGPASISGSGTLI